MYCGWPHLACSQTWPTSVAKEYYNLAKPELPPVSILCSLQGVLAQQRSSPSSLSDRLLSLTCPHLGPSTPAGTAALPEWPVSIQAHSRPCNSPSQPGPPLDSAVMWTGVCCGLAQPVLHPMSLVHTHRCCSLAHPDPPQFQPTHMLMNATALIGLACPKPWLSCSLVEAATRQGECPQFPC